MQQLAHTCDTVASAVGCGFTRAEASLEMGVPSLSQDSSGPRANLRGLMHGHLLQQHKPCGYSQYHMPSVPSTQKSAQLSKVHLVCVFSGVLLPSADLNSLPLPFCLEKEKQKGNVSCIWYCATMAAACDCLLGWFFTGNEQDADIVRKGIWTSLQLLDTILLL